MGRSEDYEPDRYVTRLGDETKWYAIDFDGTIASSVWKTSRGIGEPMMGNVDKLWELRRKGKKIVIYTARPWFDYEAIERWMNDHAIPFDKIICGKLLVHRYIDDKNILIESESWL